MKETRVLVVDDEVSILKYVGARLRKEGYEVITARDGVEGLLRAEEENPSLIILDIIMPKMTGFEVCRRLREWTRVPIIMLSARGDESDKVKCLDLGADDYITKPFGAEEFMARVRAVLRRTDTSATTVLPAFVAGDLRIGFAERRVTLGEQEVKLTPTEYNLLQELVLNAGKTLTYTHLLHKVWGPDYSDEREYLHSFMHRLRNKLKQGETDLRYIVSIPGVGYQFKSENKSDEQQDVRPSSG